MKNDTTEKRERKRLCQKHNEGNKLQKTRKELPRGKVILGVIDQLSGAYSSGQTAETEAAPCHTKERAKRNIIHLPSVNGSQMERK